MAQEDTTTPQKAPAETDGHGHGLRAAIAALEEASASLRVPLPRRQAAAVRRLSAELDRQDAAAAGGR